MSNTKKAPAKGNEQKGMAIVKPTATVKKPTILKPTEPQKKMEDKKVAEIIQGFAPPSAEERIKNAENFKILTNKFEHLNKKSDELQRFKISSDGTKEKIYLENAEGFKFEVSNSKIIDEVLKLLEATLCILLFKSISIGSKSKQGISLLNTIILLFGLLPILHPYISNLFGLKSNHGTFEI